MSKRKKRHKKAREEQATDESQEKGKPAQKLDTRTEERHSRVSVILYSAAAVLMGFASIIASRMIGNMATIFLGIVVSWVAGRAVQSFLGKKDVKWLIGNGLFIYFFVWLISWIAFFNMLQ